ncbi:MAG: hypothetical protein ACKV22_19800 [Bryobacteraceae bacterium]
MTTDEILQLLITERDRLSAAIAALQGLPARGRRGRPPKQSKVASASVKASGPKRGRRKFTKAQREAHAERMRQYWAKRRKQ